MHKMPILAIVNRKGGTGKTTVASLIAVAACQAGEQVFIIDADPMAGLYLWWQTRAADTPALVDIRDGGLSQALQTARALGGTLVVIDTPPADFTVDATNTGVIASVVAVADLVVVPIQASPMDLRAVGSAVSLIRGLHTAFVFVINRVKPRVRLTDEIIRGLAPLGPIAGRIADRTAYAAAAIDGRTAPELNPHGEAAGEIAALWDFLTQTLNPKG